MSLVKYPRCEGTELKVYNMELFCGLNLLVGLAYVIWFACTYFEERSKEQDVDMYVRQELKKRGIEVNWNKRLTYADFKAIVKDM